MSQGSVYLMIATFLFSLMQVCVKLVAHFPTSQIVFFRALIAFFACILVIRFRKISFWGQHHGLLLLRGVFGTAALFLFFYTLQVLPLATAVTVHYLAPLFTILIASLFLHERASPTQWVFLFTALGGVALIKGFDTSVSMLELSLGVIAAIFSAAAYNVIRLLAGKEEPITVVLYFPMVTLPVVGPIAVRQWVMPSGIEWVYLILVGLFTQFAQIFMTKGYQSDRAANIVSINYLGIVYALGFGFFFFEERLSLANLSGIFLIVISILLSGYIRKRR